MNQETCSQWKTESKRHYEHAHINQAGFFPVRFLKRLQCKLANRMVQKKKTNREKWFITLNIFHSDNLVNFTLLNVLNKLFKSPNPFNLACACAYCVASSSSSWASASTDYIHSHLMCLIPFERKNQIKLNFYIQKIICQRKSL